MNIRSVLGNHFDELCLNLNEIKTKFSVTVLSETCLLPNENHPIVEGYTSYAVCRNCNENRGGGLLVYVLEITLSANNVIYICGIYRPPWSKITDFNREFFGMTKKYIKG